MTPRKSIGSASKVEPSPAKRALDSFVARIAQLRASQGPPAPRTPRRRKLHARHATWWSAFWTARLAVRSGVSLDTFLQHRLSQHLSRLPVEPARLPFHYTVEGGVVVKAPNPESESQPPWLEAYLRANGSPTVTPEILLAQADSARLAARIDAQRARADELSRDVAAATRGVEIADPGDDAQAQLMGRPDVPAPFGVALQVFAMVLLLAESWPLAIACMEAAGIQSTHLVAEFQRDPIAVLLGSLFALGAAAALFLIAHLTVRRTLRAAATQPASRQRVWTAVAAFVAVLLTIAMAWSTAGVGEGQELPIIGSHERLTVFFAVLAIPFTSAWLFTIGERLERARVEARALARAWDREHYRILADLSRRAAALTEQEQQLSDLGAQRAAVIRRIGALQHRCAVAERLAADAAGEEHQDLAALDQGLAWAIELDRYEYVRQAAARGIQVERPEVAAAPALQAPVRAPREVPERNLGLAG